MELGVHVGTQDRVDAGLIGAVGAKPIEKIGVEAHRDGSLAARQYNFGRGPETRVRRVGLGVCRDGRMDLGVRQGAKPLPVGVPLSRLSPRSFSGTRDAHEAPISMLISGTVFHPCDRCR